MGKQNYTEWKLAEAKRIRHKAWKDERDKRLAQSVADKEKNKDKKPEDWLSPRLKELRAKKKAQAKEQKAKQKDKRTADIASSRSYYRKVIKPMLRAA